MHVTAELAVGNIVRRVLHIIREEDLSFATDAITGLGLSASDDEDDAERDDHPGLSAAAVAAAARSTLRPPSLQTLLEDMPDSAAVPHTSSSGGESEGKSRCEESLFCYNFLDFDDDIRMVCENNWHIYLLITVIIV